MEQSNNDLLSLIIIKIFIDADYAQWGTMQRLAVENDQAQDLNEYFDRLFKYGIPTYSLPKNTPVFRARKIKNNNFNELGCNFNEILDELYDSFLQKEDFDKIKGINLPISMENLFCLKCCQTEHFPDSFIKKAEEIQRRYSQKNFYGFPADKCGCPPQGKGEAGRLNIKGDNFLYISLEKDTALYEMRPHIKQIFSLADGITNKELVLANLRDIPKYTPDSNLLLNNVLDKISEPNIEEDDGFYKITQILSHKIKEKNLDGILYRSALKKDGSNILLFDEKDVKYTSTDIIRINDIAIDYSTILPLEK